MPSDHQAKHDPPLPWSVFLDELDQFLPNLSRSIASADLSSVCCTDSLGRPEILITLLRYRVIAYSSLKNSQDVGPSSKRNTRFTFSTSRWPRCLRIMKLE